MTASLRVPPPAPLAVPGVASRPARADLLLLLLSGYVLVNVWRVQDLFPVVRILQAPILVAGLSYGVYLLDSDPARRLARIKHPLASLSLLMLAAVSASAIFGIWPGNTVRFLYNDYLKTLALMVLLAASIRSLGDLRTIVLIQVLGGLIYCVTILNRFTVGRSGRLGDLVFYDANDLAMLLVVTLPFLVLFAKFATTARLRLLAGLGLVVYLATIVKTGSRGGFLALLAVAAYVLLGFRVLSRRVRMAAVTVGLLGLVVLGNKQYWDTMRTILNPSADYNFSGNSRAGRMEVWKRGMGYLAQHPVFGIGARNFAFAEGTISPMASLRVYNIGFKWSAPHNSFVEAATETGLVGFGVFVALLVVALRSAWRIGQRAPPGAPTFESALGQALVASLIGYCVAAFFLTQAFAAILYVLFALLIGLHKLGATAVPGAPMPLPRPRTEFRSRRAVLR